MLLLACYEGVVKEEVSTEVEGREEQRISGKTKEKKGKQYKKKGIERNNKKRKKKKKILK